MNQSTTSWLGIFGTDATGSSVQDRAASSKIQFVRGQDELSVWEPNARGRTFTAKEALRLFGRERLKKIWENGSAILPVRPSEPSRTLRERREALGLTQTELATYVGLEVKTIAEAESPDYRSRIFDLMKIATALGLDEGTLGFKHEPSGDSSVAVRLKTWRQRTGAKPQTVATMSEISWVMMTQFRLQQLLTPSYNPLAGFTPDGNYGNFSWPAWDVAGELARETRTLLGLSATEPIRSTRELCQKLQIPLVHAQLPKHIAGATLATGGVRGIAINTFGNDNVWVQRATVAHELGHLLWDPDESLKTLVVDTHDQVQTSDRDNYSKAQDWIEARANAFAVELLAPRSAVRDYVGQLASLEPTSIADAVRRCMEHFGLSLTAMTFYLWNTYNRDFDLKDLPTIDFTPTDEWNGQELYADDMLRETPITRRGQFAGTVVEVEKSGWLTETSAAFYLKMQADEYLSRRDTILDMYPPTP